jgi:GcrA cell cycle regulator
MNWTDERINLLKTLWTEGLSASQIAAELGGVTRNSVIGKVHRLKLPRRAAVSPPEAAGRKRARKPRRALKAPWRQIQAEPPKFVSEAPAGPVEASMPIPTPTISFLELDNCPALPSRCRWPFGDPAKEEVRYCGKRPIAGLPFCGYHCRLAYQPLQPRRRVA